MNILLHTIWTDVIYPILYYWGIGGFIAGWFLAAWTENITDKRKIICVLSLFGPIMWVMALVAGVMFLYVGLNVVVSSFLSKKLLPFIVEYFKKVKAWLES